MTEQSKNNKKLKPAKKVELLKLLCRVKNIENVDEQILVKDLNWNEDNYTYENAYMTAKLLKEVATEICKIIDRK